MDHSDRSRVPSHHTDDTQMNRIHSTTNMVGMTVTYLGDVPQGDRSMRIDRRTQRSWSRPLPMNRLQLSRTGLIGRLGCLE